MKNELISKAIELGKQARLNNKPCVSGYDKSLLELVKQTKALDKPSELFKAWNTGWTNQNIKMAWESINK